MDEADQILVTDLNSVGMKIESLTQLDSTKFICSIGMTFESISKLMGRDDFFDKEKLQMMMNFAEVSNKFALCQVITNYLKKLGYSHYYDPNINHIRKVLAHLFEYIWKKEEEAKAAAGTSEDYAEQMGEKENFSFVLKRKLDNWIKQPWIMPEFRIETKNTFARLRNRIHLFAQRDEANMQNTKNKKLQGVHSYLEEVKLDSEKLNTKNKNIFTLKISETAFYDAYNKKIGGGGLLGEDETAAENKANQNQSFLNSCLIPNKVRNIEEIIKNRKMNLKINPQPSIEHLEANFNLFNRKVKFEQDNDFAQKLIVRMNEARKKKAKEGAKEEFISEEVEKQRKKNELELQEYEKEITKIKKQHETFLEESIEVSNNTLKLSESNTSLKSDIDLKKREWKKKTDLMKELTILQKQGVSGLDKELADLEKTYQDLQKQWEDYQKPIQEEIYKNKNKLKDMKLEYGFKQEQIGQIKKNIKKSLAELKYKKEMLKFMEEEYAKLPKDINRNQYIKIIDNLLN